MYALIVCNGSIIDYSFYRKFFDEADFIVCADGGALHLQRLGIKPDVLLGDFDSIESEHLEYYMKQNVEILKFPAEKDMTDTELAVNTAIDRGYKNIVIIGGTGTRLDHTLSNIFLLKLMLDRGVKGRIINEYNEMFLINDSTEIEAEDGCYLTLLPLTSKVEGITTEGLYYPLRGEAIEMGSTRGVSNCFVEKKARISITSGILIAIKTRE